MFPSMWLVVAMLLVAPAISLSPPSNCPADIAFIVDSSDSVGVLEMAEVIAFLKFIVAAFNQYVTIGVDHAVALARFSQRYEMICLLVDHANLNSFLTAVDTLDDPGRPNFNTALTLALDGVHKCGNTSGPCQAIFGNTGDDANRANFAIVITDGGPDNKFTAEIAAINLKNTGATIIVIGVGCNDAQENFLRTKIASNPSFYFHVTDFGNLKKVEDVLVAAICNVDPRTTFSSSSRTTSSSGTTSQPHGAGELCRQCLERDNQRNFFADPNDCTRYLQCYRNGTSVSMPCADGMYWNDYVLTCVPDILGNCNNPCSAFATPAGGIYTWAERVIYPIDDCTYLVCDNGYGLPQCCSDGTALTDLGPGPTGLTHYGCRNATLSGIPLTPLCNSNGTPKCLVPWYPPPVITSPVVTFSNGSCLNGNGELLSPYINSSDPTSVFYFIQDGKKRPCADNTVFSATACLCVDMGNGTHVWPTHREHCLLYLPFSDPQDPWKDWTVHRRKTMAYGDVVHSVGQAGQGVEFRNGGRLETAGMMSVDYRNSASFCFFYMCTTNCDGGLLSNAGNNTADWSVRFGLTAVNSAQTSLHGDLNVYFPQGTHLTTHTSGNQQGWIHVCGVLSDDDLLNPSGSFTWKIYKELTLVQTSVTQGGDVKIVHCPLTLGTDHLYGNFTGFMDEVLVCPYAFTQNDRFQHRHFNMSHFNLPAP